MPSRKNKPLSVRVTRDGVLTIEIGIDTNAWAALLSEIAYELADPERTGRCADPRAQFEIRNARGFARDVKRALLEEAEDGSSLLTKLFDDATRRAIEDGSEFFLDKADGQR